jgi:nitrate reductase gamma subunit
MDEFVHLVTYAAVIVFVAAVIARFWRISRYPLNVRWEVYPVPHEGARAKHGGSRLEESDWWEKKHRPDKIMEARHMLPEMLFIKALFEHNRRLWYRSFPFHFGLYLLIGFLGLLVLRAVIGLAGGAPALVPGVLVVAVGAAGFVLTLVGALGLIVMRLTDPGMRPYTNVSHHFNLAFIVVALGTLFVGWIGAGWSLAPFDRFVVSLLTFAPAADVGSTTLAVGFLLTALLVAYIPLTHMSHFFVKWFTWHKIRWDDEPNVRGGRIEKLIQNALNSPVSWSAPHIRADGRKTWADIATEEEDNR